jgi:hypothetical protein
MIRDLLLVCIRAVLLEAGVSGPAGLRLFISYVHNYYTVFTHSNRVRTCHLVAIRLCIQYLEASADVSG